MKSAASSFTLSRAVIALLACLSGTAGAQSREVYTWTDTSDSVVTCTFVGGKLTEWTLVRPEVPSEVGTPERPEGPNP